MSYSRPCGVYTAACAANTCRCAPTPTEPVIGPHTPTQAELDDLFRAPDPHAAHDSQQGQ